MPDGSVCAAAQFYIYDDTGCPIEELDATTLAGAVAEAKEIAAEAALEDAVRFGLSGREWGVYTLDGRSDKYVLEASGVERVDAKLLKAIRKREADELEATGMELFDDSLPERMPLPVELAVRPDAGSELRPAACMGAAGTAADAAAAAPIDIHAPLGAPRRR